MTKRMMDILIRIASKYSTESGCRIRISSPVGQYLDTLKVTEVYDSGVIAGYSEESNFDTSYDITDGIQIEFLD